MVRLYPHPARLDLSYSFQLTSSRGFGKRPTDTSLGAPDPTVVASMTGLGTA